MTGSALRHRGDRRAMSLLAVAVTAAAVAAPAAAWAAGVTAPFGTFALSGAAAREFRLPVDVQTRCPGLLGSNGLV